MVGNKGREEGQPKTRVKELNYSEEQQDREKVFLNIKKLAELGGNWIKQVCGP